MQVIHKDAAITAPLDDDFPGTFEAILSAPTKDRDGDTLLPHEWKMPLPEHITVDMDHQMTVAGTIGSAHPWIDDSGNLRISGKFASTAKAQEVRTLMQEGHINRTSVAFMSERTRKDGVTQVKRELLNAAIVAIPSNREAVVLSAKALEAKAGRRNSTTDQAHLDAILEHAIALGASGGDTDDDGDVAAAKSYRPTLKSTIGDIFARHDAGEIEPTEALTLIRAATATGEPATTSSDGNPDEEADSGALPAPASDAAEQAASDADAKSAPVEDASIDQQVMAARKRFYYASTLNEGN